MSDSTRLLLGISVWILAVWILAFAGSGVETPNFFSQWDAWWYHAIAKDGYSVHLDRYDSTAFFPLYPLLIRLVSTPVSLFFNQGVSLVISGVLISILSTVAFSLILFQLFLTFLGRQAAVRSMALLFLFPSSFFFVTVYSEAIFLLFSSGAFLMMFRRRWILAGVLSGMAALTRPTGVLLVMPFLIEALRHHRYPSKAALVGLLVLALIVFLYPLYLFLQFGNPLTMILAYRAWDVPLDVLDVSAVKAVRALTHEFGRLWSLGWAGWYLLIQYSGGTLLGLWASWFWFRRKHWSFALYTALGIIIPLFTGGLIGMIRFPLVLFPIYPVISSLKSQMYHRVVIVSSVLLAINIMMFGNGLWIS